MHIRNRILVAVLCLFLTVSTLTFSGAGVTYDTSSNYDSGVYCDRLRDTLLTGHPRVDIVNIALSQYGYAESNNGWDLTGMKEGVGNYTEYGHWYGIQSMWCAMFVSWCAKYANIPQEVIPPHAYTPSGVLWFMDRDQVYSRSQVENGEYIPQAGDIIYFRSDRNNSLVNHVGIVLGYFDGYVYTVEGNVNFDPNCTDGGQVLVRSRHISDTFIRYFCCPNYSSNVTHEIGDFFSEEEIRPIPENEQLSFTEPTEESIELPSDANASDRSQFDFIP